MFAFEGVRIEGVTVSFQGVGIKRSSVFSLYMVIPHK